MNLIFFDRSQAADRPATGLPVLNIRPDGNFTLTAGAVATHRLQDERWVALAQDTDTKAWYLAFGPKASPKPFSLQVQRGKSSLKLAFNSAVTARRMSADFQPAGDTKSIRLLLTADTTVFGRGHLFRLSAEGSPLPEVAVAVLAVSVIEQPAAPAPEPAEVVARVTEQATPEAATVVAPTEPVAVPKAPLGALPESRAEQLADYWYEREISKAEASDLSELLKVLGNTPKGDRGFKENVVLGRAKAENARRGKVKGAQNRG